ncbi:acyclic terpene utilization AtuA family protein [Acinetobacter gerneri]|uniref:Acyclic terpene utilization AtuA family protein n=1 Tax=Acinetobacter gerneri TaxID=202952 RepID=A0AAW8JDL9_9GAMM|nr:acyclic terpene utilization AtuA family protein [Acinetobacter gerneri]MDQ9009885.1 acyclic terpene utilization AtuA family protein [Acinetobacter gerneri]MDQ9014195.1 acyclic terpene utilization AtuA family protein [Acinetobacter gerneri]MDQ9025163.1 acyclic terpene utilization AtuA family protein [Acinetobacter gerneri]MDQ9050706.1 acyclic terpene utilization AtuA family protein [Acinetobacter gerneri]MDQ9060167.1 acyclic terpene utilization AtuA family protein [Acinetobacter gerneri]
MGQEESRVVKIGCASGFWGDTNTAAFQLVHLSDIDYLVFDYLSEITMSIMAKAMMLDPNHGYALDFVSRVMTPLLKKIAAKKIKVVSNAGGVNPMACKAALEKVIQDQGLDLKVAVVLGDDLMPKQTELQQQKIKEMFSGEALPAHLASCNAYLGAIPIGDALDQGADIVITGRVVDSAVVLGPLLHEYQWAIDDYDKLAQGSLAGHIIECGAQCTGGNFTDWRLVQGFDNMGFPIVEVAEDASFIVTKPNGTGGLVSTATVAEQIVYEIADPQAYLLPDVTADFSNVVLEQVAEHRVKVTGAKGCAPKDQYKVSATYPDGYRVQVSFLIAGREAVEKAKVISDAILSKCERVLALRSVPAFSEKSVEILGIESTYGAHAQNFSHSREVVVKIAVKHLFKEACMFFASEIAQASTGMAPALAGIVGGRPKASPVIKLFSFLIDKDQIQVEIELNNQRQAIDIPRGTSDLSIQKHPIGEVAKFQGNEIEVALIELAHARSGDKGNASNIGVIARKAEYLPWIRANLTEENVAAYMQHVLDPVRGKVIRYEMPALNALNFVLENALGGGGVASLRIDPQGKAYAQQLLDMKVKIPEGLLK